MRKYVAKNVGPEWKPIPLAPGYFANPAGKILGPRSKIMKAQKRGDYLWITLIVDGAQIGRPIHRLVCEAFHGPCPPDKDLVAHWDGDELNNSASNLRWATFKENTADMQRHGTFPAGELNGCATISNAKALQILLDHRAATRGKTRASPGTLHLIAAHHAVTREVVKGIVTGRTFKIVSTRAGEAA